MTTTEIQERLNLYLAAEKKILEGNQSYSTKNGMSFTRADLPTIQNEIRRLRNELAMAQNGGVLTFSNVVFGGRR